PIKVKSLVCGHEFDTTPDRLLHANYYTRGCSRCTELRDCHDDMDGFKAKLAKTHPHIKVIGGKYEGVMHHLKMKCTQCNHTYMQTPSQALNTKFSCSVCATYHT